MLFHRFSPRHCEWRGAELEASTKGSSVPWRMRLVKAFDPIPYPGEVRSMKQIDHEKTSGRVAGRYEGQLEFGVKQLRGVMLKFGLWHSAQIQTPATGRRRDRPSKLSISFQQRPRAIRSWAGFCAGCRHIEQRYVRLDKGRPESHVLVPGNWPIKST